MLSVFKRRPLPAACVFQKVQLDVLWSMLCWMTRVSTQEKETGSVIVFDPFKICLQFVRCPLLTGMSAFCSHCYLDTHPLLSLGTSTVGIHRMIWFQWAGFYCDWELLLILWVLLHVRCSVEPLLCFFCRSAWGDPEITRRRPDVSIGQLQKRVSTNVFRGSAHFLLTKSNPVKHKENVLL